MNDPELRPFNLVAGQLDSKARKALIEAMWSGHAEITDETSQATISVVPDATPVAGEDLFYVGFLGSSRDRIPSQHYMIAAPDLGEAVKRAHKSYVLQPRHRKGSSLRI